jgi:hypothetical protein
MAVKSNFFFWLDNVKQIFSSETAWPNEAKLGRKHLCKVLYKLSLFRSVWPANMATESNPLKLLGQIKPNLAGSIYRFLLYIPRRVFHLFLFSNRGRALYNWTNSSHIFPDRIWLFVYGKMMFCLANQYCLSDFLTTQCPKKHCNECLWIQICLLIISPSSDLCHIFIIVSSSNTASHRWTIYLVCKHIVRCTCQSGKYSLTLTSFSQSCDLQHILKLLSFE